MSASPELPQSLGLVRSSNPSPLPRYASALGVTALSAVFTYLMLGWLDSSISPIFLIGVVFVAWYAGLRPALVSALLSTVICNLVFVQPMGSFGADDLLRLAMFMIGAVFVGSLTMARREAEAATRAAQKQLNITLKSIGDAVITTDANGRINFMNAIAQSLTGWRQDEANGRAIDEIFNVVDPQTRCEVESVASRVLRDNVILGLGEPVHMVSRDGTIMAVDQVAAPVRDHRGHINGLVLVLRSIPEARPKDTKRLLTETITLLDAVDAKMFAVDLENRCAFVSKATVQLLGYPLHELIGKDINDLSGFSELSRCFSEERRQVPPDRNTLLTLGTLRHRNGTSVPVEFSRAPLVVSGETVGTVITLTDLTERRRAEEAITRLESISDSVEEAIITHTAEGIITSWNRAAERIYGFVEDEVLGRNISIVHPPGYKQELRSLFDRVLTQKRIEPFETVRIRKGGERVFVSINAVPLNDAAGSPVIIAQIVSDLTTLKKAEEAATRANSNRREASAPQRSATRVVEPNSEQIAAVQAIQQAAQPVRNTIRKAVAIGRSTVMEKLFATIRKVAPTDSSVLITGKTGTGKELVARAIHEQSRRAGGPFIDLNCSAVPETLIEAELFGHQRGSFTGAHENRVGLFEAASGGTLFLDEVDALPLAAQAKLLRVLQEKRIRRVGGRTNIDVDVRIISASNSDLNVAVKENRFRADLFYRLRVFPVDVPELKQREGDISLLIDHFLQRHADLYGTEVRTFTPDARAILLQYSWPGNVRELENAVEFALAIGTTDELCIEDLPPEFAAAAQADLNNQRSASRNTGSESAHLAEIEKRHILTVLQQCEGNQVRAAAALGIDRGKLYRRLRQYGIKAVKFLQEEQGDGMQLFSSRSAAQ